MSETAVKAAFQFFLQASNLGGIVRGDHAVCKLAQFFWTEARSGLFRSCRFRFSLYLLHCE